MNNKLVTYNNNRIILSHERKKMAVMDIYPSNHLLTYIREGMLKVKQGKEVQCFTKGEFVLFKKFTPSTITKTWCGESNKFSSLVFTFHEDPVKEALFQLNSKPEHKTAEKTNTVIGIIPNPILNQFIHSLSLFFDEGLEMDQQMAYLKTTEALIGLMKSDASVVDQLQHFSQKSKADLYQYMNYHYRENKKLETFARESGRSLSVFKKDFSELFNNTPYKWLKKKRLEYAYALLNASEKKASEIYLECGFEDLAHFSKSFKRQYGFNPSEIRKPYRQVS